jgi:hypothetical protein
VSYSDSLRNFEGEQILERIASNLEVRDFQLSEEEIEYFFQINNRIPSDSDWGVSTEEGFFLFSMAAVLRPNLIVEVGTCSGNSTSFLLGGIRKEYLGRQSQPPIAVQAFDLAEYCEPVPTKRIGFAVSHMAPEMQTALQLNTSRTAVDIKDFCPKSFVELAFIDANHDHPYPLLDLIHLLSCMKKNAWIMLHDLNLPKYLREQEQEHERIGDHGPAWLYRLWPGKKFSIGTKNNNVGAIQLPSDKSMLISLSEKLLRMPFERNPKVEEIELAKKVLTEFVSTK